MCSHADGQYIDHFLFKFLAPTGALGVQILDLCLCVQNFLECNSRGILRGTSRALNLHICQALVPSPVLLDPKPNQNQSKIKIQVQSGLG